MHSGETIYTFMTLNKTVSTDNSLSSLGILPHELTKKEVYSGSDCYVKHDKEKKKHQPKKIPNRAAREFKSMFFCRKFFNTSSVHSTKISLCLLLIKIINKNLYQEFRSTKKKRDTYSQDALWLSDIFMLVKE